MTKQVTIALAIVLLASSAWAGGKYFIPQVEEHTETITYREIVGYEEVEVYSDNQIIVGYYEKEVPDKTHEEEYTVTEKTYDDKTGELVKEEDVTKTQIVVDTWKTESFPMYESEVIGTKQVPVYETREEEVTSRTVTWEQIDLRELMKRDPEAFKRHVNCTIEEDGLDLEGKVTKVHKRMSLSEWESKGKPPKAIRFSPRVVLQGWEPEMPTDTEIEALLDKIDKEPIEN